MQASRMTDVVKPRSIAPSREANDPGFGVYLHWPFCAQKCPYCDFNSHVRFGGVDEARYLAAFRRELATTASLTGPRTVSSVFLGGGTPSLMSPATVAGLIAAVADCWSLAPGAEITLEANPNSVEADRFAGYRAAGVNRVSIGVQSLRDNDLKKLGRLHDAAEARAAIGIARRTFERFSFDLIYAREGQSLESWRAELVEALGFAGGHLSLYQLTIEPETPFARWHAAGKLSIPDDDQARALYELTQEMTAKAGLPAYEISNHARPGEESRHNLLYWRYGEYAGVGPGAHGRLVLAREVRDGSPISASFPRRREPTAHLPRVSVETASKLDRVSDHIASDPVLRPVVGSRLRGNDVENGLAASDNATPLRAATSTERNPERWLSLVEATGHGLIESAPLTRPEQADEMLLMGMRLREGLDAERMEALTGLRLSHRSVNALANGGMIEAGAGRIRATPEGAMVLNDVVARLSASLVAARSSTLAPPARMGAA